MGPNNIPPKKLLKISCEHMLVFILVVQSIVLRHRVAEVANDYVLPGLVTLLQASFIVKMKYIPKICELNPFIVKAPIYLPWNTHWHVKSTPCKKGIGLFNEFVSKSDPLHPPTRLFSIDSIIIPCKCHVRRDITTEILVTFGRGDAQP